MEAQGSLEIDIQLSENSIKRITDKWLKQEKIRQGQAADIYRVLAANGKEEAQRKLEHVIEENGLRKNIIGIDE